MAQSRYEVLLPFTLRQNGVSRRIEKGLWDPDGVSYLILEDLERRQKIRMVPTKGSLPQLPPRPAFFVDNTKAAPTGSESDSAGSEAQGSRAVPAGAVPKYDLEYLQTLKMGELKILAENDGLTVKPFSKKVDLIEALTALTL